MIAKPVPILLLVRELGPGGTERQLTEIARSLDRTRFTVHVGCFHEGFRAAELRAAGITIVRFPVTSFLNPSVVRGALLLGLYLRRHRIQLVHTFDYPLNCFAVPVARAFGVPVVLSSQRAFRALTPRPYLKLLRLTDHLVSGIVVNSSAVRTDLIENEHLPPGRLHLCHNGIDTAQFHAGNRTRVPTLAAPGLIIGVVCLLRPEKGLPSLIEAYAKVSPRVQSLRLAIIGSGPELDRLESLAQRLHVEDLCLFQPTVTNVADWLRSIDIFVLPSLSEALSNSLMEAMACACCCLASRTGGNPELIREGQTGLLFEPGNSNDLATRLLEVLNDPALRRRLARNAETSIRRHFSLAASVTQMQNIYAGMLEQMSRKNQ